MPEQSFYLQALIYLSAAVIAVPIAKRSGLTSILGYLLAGMIIGPWGLKLITNVDSIIHIAEFGVVLLLFLIGLELNPQRLWQLRRSILGMGATQVILSIFIISSLSLIFHLSIPIALVIGMGFAMSSTAIALQTLTEKNLLNTPAGQNAISVSLFQDIAVIPLILILSLLKTNNSISDITQHWPNIIKAILLIIGLITAGRFLLRPILRYIANTGLREIFIALSLFIVVGTALLMQTVGLSMALGTFLAGVILADSEYRYELELDIEPFKGLLLGLFFIAIGMSLNIGLLLQHIILITCLTVAVIITKFIILYYIARWFKETRSDAQIFACYLSQAGEFAFVLFNIAFTGHILPPYLTDVLKSIVALSMFATPFILMAYEYLISKRTPKSVNEKTDIIDEHHPVIIAGYGRVGGIIGRLLQAKGIRTTVIDRDPNQITLVQKYGYRAYYGDITRLDLLLTAGAAKAKLLILAIDDSNAALETAKLVRQYFPHLKVIARARGRADAYEFVEEHIPVFRETFGSAIAMGEAALIALGHSAYSAKRAAHQFQKHDIALLNRGVKHRGDQQALITLAKQGRTELEKLLRAEKSLRKEPNVLAE